MGHERFRPNVIKMLARLGENPKLSFSATCGPAVRKSAHRLFSRSDIELQKGHNYSSHKPRRGWVFGEAPKEAQGINIHSVLLRES